MLPAPPPLPGTFQSRRVRAPAHVWWLYLPGAITTFIGLTLLFDTTSEQTQAERGIEQSLALLILIVSALLTVPAILITFLRPHRCASCQTKVKKFATHCPSCHAQFPN